MLLDKTEWYVLGAKEGCFTFWINLEPDRFIELIDGKSLADDQGIWREDRIILMHYLNLLLYLQLSLFLLIT